VKNGGLVAHSTIRAGFLAGLIEEAMPLSALITQLTAIQSEHGDLKCLYCCCSDFASLSDGDITVQPAKHVWGSSWKMRHHPTDPDQAAYEQFVIFPGN
jgi:hypothetical protein